MPFDKGQSGNPEGRPKGTINKTSAQLRETITLFLDQNFERIVKDFARLKPRDRVKFYCDLLQYSVPKLQAMQLETEFDKLSDAQLNYIIEDIRNSNAEKQNQ